MMLRLGLLCAAVFALSSLVACAGAYYAGDIGRHRHDDPAQRRVASQPAVGGCDTFAALHNRARPSILRGSTTSQET
jgi:hypothetical protein